MTATKKHSVVIPRDHTAAAVNTVIRGTDEVVLVSLKFGNEAKFCKLCEIVIFSDLQYQEIRLQWNYCLVISRFRVPSLSSSFTLVDYITPGSTCHSKVLGWELITKSLKAHPKDFVIAGNGVGVQRPRVLERSHVIALFSRMSEL